MYLRDECSERINVLSTDPLKFMYRGVAVSPVQSCQVLLTSAKQRDHTRVPGCIKGPVVKMRHTKYVCSLILNKFQRSRTSQYILCFAKVPLTCSQTCSREVIKVVVVSLNILCYCFSKARTMLKIKHFCKSEYGLHNI